MASPLALHKLPTEILQNIFLCVPHDRGQTLQSPLRLGQVCTRWRDVALAYPLLWSQLIYRSRGYRYRKVPRVQPLLHTILLLLDRSQSCPLSIEVYERNEVTAGEIITVLVPHFHRCRIAEFHVFPLALRTLTDPSSPLHSYHSIPCNTDDVLASENGSGIAPFDHHDEGASNTYTSVHTSHIGQPLLSHSWLKLLELTLHDISILDLIRILNMAPNLVALNIEDIYDHWNDNYPTITIALPNLRHLRVCYYIGILQLLSTPTLESLSLRIGIPLIFEVDIIGKFLRQQCLTIRQLKIEVDYDIHPGLNVTTINFSSLVQELTYNHHHESHLLPRLANLVLLDEYLDGAALVKMIESRWADHDEISRLESVEISEQSLTIRDNYHLQGFQANGLKVVKRNCNVPDALIELDPSFYWNVSPEPSLPS